MLLSIGGDGCFWAPEVVFHNGSFIMHYSARWGKPDTLRMGVAVSSHPEGPWIKHDCANPVLSCHEDLFGAGHNAFFYDKEGVLRTAFHVQTDPAHPSGDRRVCIGTVVFKEADGVVYQEII